MNDGVESTAPAVIFDMDGVLVDSYAPHFLSWRDTAREYGCEMTEEQFRETFGRTSRDIVKHFFGDRLDDDAAQALDRRKEARYRERVEQEFPWMPGALELMESLVQEGWRLGIGSSGPPENVQLLLARLNRPHWIRAHVTGADVRRGKPDPEVFSTAAQRLGVEPARCVVIEDAPAGIEAARAAGTKALGLATDEQRAHALRLAGAHRVVAHLSEVSPASLHALLAAVAAN